MAPGRLSFAHSTGCYAAISLTNTELELTAEAAARGNPERSGIEIAPTYGMFRGDGIWKREADQRIGTCAGTIAGRLPAEQNGLLWA